MAKDIEEFLKMAAKRRQQQKEQGSSAAARAQQDQQERKQRAQQEQRRQQQRRQQQQQIQRPGSPATDDEIMVIGDSQSTDMWQESVAEHVQSHIDTDDLVEHATQLGHEVSLADDKLDARLEKTFDHGVGRITLGSARLQPRRSARVDPATISPVATELLEMLSNPKNIRQAILVAEVLKRPQID